MSEFACPKCNKAFARQDALNYHINRKFSCIISERPAQQNKALLKEKKMEELEQKVDAQAKQLEIQTKQIENLFKMVNFLNLGSRKVLVDLQII